MREAVARTIEGFEAVVRALPAAEEHRRGERVIETTFDGHARLEGNAVGYETIAASGEHATTLHWIRNDGAGPLRRRCVLLDAGVEIDSLYTADVTRTLPVDGEFTEVQRSIYQAVLDAADAAFAVAKPGAKFRDVHAAAMEVIAARLEEWGFLPGHRRGGARAEGQHHRRWMVHGTCHHLGLDVHDCAQARAELYLDGSSSPAWCSPSSRVCTSRPTTCCARGVPRHRRAHRGRRAGHRGRQREPVRRAPPRPRRRRGLDGGSA